MLLLRSTASRLHCCGVARATAHRFTTSTTATTLATTAKKTLIATTSTRPRPSGLRRALAAAAGLGLAAFGVQYYRDEGTRRSVAFWRIAFPIYLHYRLAEWWTLGKSEEEIDRTFNALHERYAPITERLVLKLRGFYLKNAQFVSMVDFFVPPQYLAFCKRMQSEVPTEFAPGEAESVVCSSLGLSSIHDVFSSFSPDPIGSASIGQVHVGVLKTTGEKVAVKVMGRGVEERFRADIQTLIAFCRLAMPQHVGPMTEIQKQFATEFDYRGEAANLLEVCNNILPVFGDRVYVPKPHMELCTKNVLVMDFVSGPSLVKGIRASFQKYAESQGTTLEKLEEEQKERMKRPDFKFRDIDSEARRMRFYSRVLRARDWVSNACVAAYNHTLVPLLRFRAKEYAESPVVLNLAEIIRLLCEVHAHEIMVDGAFSCDPHPGNVLLMSDGRLGLIDMGQFKRIPVESRIAFARIVVALAHDDQAEVVRVIRASGSRSKYNNSEVAWRLAAFWFDRNTPDITEGRNLQQFIDDMEARDPAVALNEDLVMPGRVSVMMRGLGNSFGLDLSIAKLWEPIAQSVLDRHGIVYKPKKSRAEEFVFREQ